MYVKNLYLEAIRQVLEHHLLEPFAERVFEHHLHLEPERHEKLGFVLADQSETPCLRKYVRQ